MYRKPKDRDTSHILIGLLLGYVGDGNAKRHRVCEMMAQSVKTFNSYRLIGLNELNQEIKKQIKSNEYIMFDYYTHIRITL